MARHQTATITRRTVAVSGNARWKKRLTPPSKRVGLADTALVPVSTPSMTAASATLLNDQSRETPEPLTSTATAKDVIVQVTLIRGGLTNITVPVAIGAGYEGLPLAGGTRAFDRLLDSWLSRALELGIIGLSLGRVFPINLQKAHDAGKTHTANLFLAGMGEPGLFAQDDLRFLVSNITITVKSMGYDQFASSLIGSLRHELSVGDAVRGFLEGIVDGYDRFRAITNVVTYNREHLRQSAERPLHLILVDPDEEKLRRMENAFDAIAAEDGVPGLKFVVARAKELPDDPLPEASAVDVEPDVPVTLLRVMRDNTMATSPAAGKVETDVFQFSAVSDRATAPVREQEVSAYLIRELPDRIIRGSSNDQRERYGTSLANILIPEDFRKLTEGSANLTLEVDETTANYPWEMMAHKKHSRTSFIGTSVAISRQFRSLRAPSELASASEPNP